MSCFSKHHLLKARKSLLLNLHSAMEHSMTASNYFSSRAGLWRLDSRTRVHASNGYDENVYYLLNRQDFPKKMNAFLFSCITLAMQSNGMFVSEFMRCVVDMLRLVTKDVGDPKSQSMVLIFFVKIICFFSSCSYLCLFRDTSIH